MKKMFTAIALAGICLLSSCGSAPTEKTDSPQITYDTANNKGIYTDAEAEAAESNGENDAVAEAIDYKQSEVKAINTQMLVYSCDMSIDVLDFDNSIDQFHSLIDKYNGFLESENYADDGNTGKWQYSNEQRWKTLNALVRIPSADYDKFCKEAEAIGDMRRKNASVQNLTTEYSDLKTTLSIYEAKEKRYLDILAEIKDEKEAVAVENELTDIQVEIARIKTRMNGIENDVAYSYINITIHEVREYTEDPVIEETDTFGQRLGNTVSRTWRGFLEFLEGLLFFIISVLPYALIAGIVLFIVLKIRKAIKKRKAAAAVQTAPPIIPDTPAEVSEDISEKTDDK